METGTACTRRAVKHNVRTYLQLCDALMEVVSVPVVLILEYGNDIDQENQFVSVESMHMIERYVNSLYISCA